MVLLISSQTDLHDFFVLQEDLHEVLTRQGIHPLLCFVWSTTDLQSLWNLEVDVVSQKATFRYSW